ncbi:MAG: SDR family NAD(P)-dependent oxidoreductase [Phycisphaerales bacterium]
MARDMTGRVLVVSGASSGIGAATARCAANAGMDVVLNARREDRLEQVANDVRTLGRRVEIVCGDVTDPGINAAMLEAARSRLGRLDAVFANAGYGLEGATDTLPADDLRGIFEVNFFAALDLIQQAAAIMKTQRSGHLIMCSSCVAKFAIPYYGVYSATKAAQNHVARSLRLELEPEGIFVSSVLPITTTTEFFEVAERLSSQPASSDVTPDHAPEMFVQSPDRVARAIVKCMQRKHPQPEVWTSHIVRIASGLFTVFPRLQDFAMRKEARKRRARLASSPAPPLILSEPKH